MADESAETPQLPEGMIQVPEQMIIQSLRRQVSDQAMEIAKIESFAAMQAQALQEKDEIIEAMSKMIPKGRVTPKKKKAGGK